MISRHLNGGIMSKSTLPDIRENVTGLILAGGKGSRMGGQDKGLVNYKGQPMVQSVLETLEESLDHIVISANRNIGLYQDFGYPVIADESDDYGGPLLGIKSAIEKVSTPNTLVVPCDTPDIHTEILPQLFFAQQEHRAEIAVAEVDGQIQPVIMLMKTVMGNSIDLFLKSGERKVREWVLNQYTIAVDFSGHSEWFSNINTTNDLRPES